MMPLLKTLKIFFDLTIINKNKNLSTALGKYSRLAARKYDAYNKISMHLLYGRQH